MIAVSGPLELARRHGVAGCSCADGPVAGFAADARLAIDGGLTRRARQRVCLFGTLAGFEKGAEHLREVCGWTLAPNTIGRTCKQEGGAIERWRAAGAPGPDLEAVAVPEPEAVAAAPPEAGAAPNAEAQRFRAAEGDIEMLVDGTFVNTATGWQEVKLAAVVKRPSGRAAGAWEWAARQVPRPTAVSFRVRIAEADDFAADWRPWLASLGLLQAALLTCFADGAKWIWTRWALSFPGHRGALDFFHLTEKLAEALRAVYPDRPSAQVDRAGARAAWLDSARRRLLTQGWHGLCEWVARLRAEEPERAAGPTEELLAYAAPHLNHLDYPGQLAAGRPIGSGLIEGGCKRVVGKRLKQTGARWRPDSIRPMANLVGAHWAGDWSRYWAAQSTL